MWNQLQHHHKQQVEREHADQARHQWRDNCVVLTVRWACTWSALFHTWWCHFTLSFHISLAQILILTITISIHPRAHSRWFDLFLRPLLFLPALLRLLPPQRAVPWTRHSDRHGKPLLLCRRKGVKAPWTPPTPSHWARANITLKCQVLFVCWVSLLDGVKLC